MIFAFGSDVGCGRANNEDYFYIPKEGSKLQNVAIVADGMGGYNAGEIASKSAVESAVNYMSEYGEDYIGQNCVRSAIRSANNKIMEMVKTDIRLKGMGTTMTVAVFNENSVVIGNVGDSRAYLISKCKNKITQLTKDHSYVQMLLDNGEITIEQAFEHPYKNVITRAVGVERRVRIDTFERTMEPDDIVVLCSDGLTRFVSDEEILDNMSKDCYEGVQSLVNLAKKRGGDDNITVVAGCNKEMIFDDRYKVVRQVGSGGMAKVYCAMDMKNDGKYVSIKLLKDELLGDNNMREMFKKEANIAIKLKHKNIINAQKIVEENDSMYIVLNYIEGQNLKDYIEKYGPMEENAAINVGLQISRALRYAHNNGYIHKDVKPQNIILDKDMNAYLTDFGLATKEYDSVVSRGDLVLGSVYYFSPEHAKGDAVNMRSDIYSLGIVLYELLCGKLPFDGESTHEVIMGHIHHDPVPPNEINRNISEAISQVILKAINKDYELRYVNFNNFMADMKKALKHPDGGFVEYNHVPISMSDNSFNLRKMFVSSLVIMSMFMMLFILGYSVFNNDSDQSVFGMPNLVNMELNAAEKKLSDLGVEYRIEYYERNGVKSGIVVNQSLKENSDIPAGTTVVLGVSTNSKDTTMHNLYRVNRDDAIAFLNSVNITNVTLEYIDSELPYNFVAGQEPDTGTPLKNINSVKLYLSNNHVSTVVPNLIGLNIEKARLAADANGFTLGIVYEEKGKPQSVNRQLPIGGQMETDDLSIDVWIGERENKTVEFAHDIELTIKEDSTKVTICYEDDDGIMYYIDEFTLNLGIFQRYVRFSAPTSTPKKIHVFYNNVRQRIIENVEAMSQ